MESGANNYNSILWKAEQITIWNWNVSMLVTGKRFSTTSFYNIKSYRKELFTSSIHKTKEYRLEIDGNHQANQMLTLCLQSNRFIIELCMLGMFMEPMSAFHYKKCTNNYIIRLSHSWKSMFICNAKDISSILQEYCYIK